MRERERRNTYYNEVRYVAAESVSQVLGQVECTWRDAGELTQWQDAWIKTQPKSAAVTSNIPTRPVRPYSVTLVWCASGLTHVRSRGTERRI